MGKVRTAERETPRVGKKPKEQGGTFTGDPTDLKVRKNCNIFLKKLSRRVF
jgi:hypothetical protein